MCYGFNFLYEKLYVFWWHAPCSMYFDMCKLNIPLELESLMFQYKGLNDALPSSWTNSNVSLK